MAEIIRLLGMPRVSKGEGSSVYNDFVGPLTKSVGLDPAAYRNKYRRVEAVLRVLGEQYNPASDTSEATNSGGGGTITNAGLRKVLRALRRLGPSVVADLTRSARAR
ncbi:hypothetical protein [Cellulomonas dongxiuzhuiae]|uniref:hypothetical protein n=1 Tax=Cellulomonas dongxiuzhuiae TaxID=2819979 RepID=UPI001AAEAF67|nr:hypothetical protein [Cellulomonas dongxiuzhuiae]MBO3089082.1 hypothetical protein [Cellulomonas dongxiuzhuiae]